MNVCVYLTFIYLMYCHCNVIYIAFFFFFFLRAEPVAYGSSQARGPIGATAYATATATQDLSHVCNLHHRSQ